ncbi:sigma 54-interacting transcriptional regulator [Bacillus sp. RG28]|uniref:Sigma 54-interacting transcriptional regulator n=1 Tax=Gottfriedia endophytica TaxID=2820819 RepID=A0A940NW57_9BACI|nr:sigma 54-interacting transcriptional regulator [Gottfriedia endophytica]MBP0726043.1 sigma 54-interacting transcriptional regulator [Gottfriedia endophytica]
MGNKLNDLHLTDDLLQIILDEIDIGIHVINLDGKTVIYNHKMMEIESMNQEDVLHKNLLDVFTFKENQHSTLLEALKYGKTRKHIKQTYFNNKGKEVTTINDTLPIIKNGQIVGAIEIVNDVSKINQLMKNDLNQQRNTHFTFDQIIGESIAIKSVIEEAKRSAKTSSSVLIVGETGTGKELFAQSIHHESKRSNKPFISQNCAAIPDSLIESILFGTKKGAFTGAIDKPGLFEEANGGTILLDEINSLNPTLQAKLLRVLQDQKVRRIGDFVEKELDVRVIATINEDPIEAIANNRLRKDLYYRLSVVTLFLPPLRERKNDIFLLSAYFLNKYNSRFGLSVERLDDQVTDFFLTHTWPGNVRELEHMIEGAMNLIEDEKMITSFHLPTRFSNQIYQTTHIQTLDVQLVDDQISNEKQNKGQLKEKVQEMEKEYILQVLENHNGNITRAAKELGLSRQNLQYRLKKFKLN